MSRILHNLQVPLDQSLEDYLAWSQPGHGPFRILKQSVDARRRHNPHFVYTVELADAGEQLTRKEFHLAKVSRKPDIRPIIVGSGPAGLFAALRLVERGIPCRLFERGSPSEVRIKGINRYWRYGELDPRNNVCFGEGGAGLYSDGKLITRIKSEHIPYVMNRLVQFGAPEEIEYLSNPHVGSDRLRRVIPKMREFLIQNGCEIHFDTQVTDLIVENKHIQGIKTERGETFQSPFVVLATGHSAHDIFDMLSRNEVLMEGKSFAVGLRVEHPQTWVNQTQYREAAGHPKLGSANYKLTYHDDQTGIGVYSFCMCPGGFVLSSSTEADGLVCNGMSNYHRNSPWANSAIVVTVDSQKLFGREITKGLEWRRDLEKAAFSAVRTAGGTKQLPAQGLADFVEKRAGDVRRGSSPSGEVPARLDQILPSFLYKKLLEGFDRFDVTMKGFIAREAQVYGVESRTSCPLRVTRDEVSLESLSHPGLFPAGEGAGYAGGITSAACDGIRIAEKICDRYITSNGAS
ncbi:MAG: NAD(P)/FAD-dependent oxidoreductase [Bdellovibrionales bacterium]